MCNSLPISLSARGQLQCPTRHQARAGGDWCTYSNVTSNGHGKRGRRRMRRCAGRRMRADEGEGGGNVTLLRRGWIFADVCGGSGPVGPRTGAARKRSRRRRRRSRARGGAVRIELGHRRALPLCGQSCVAGACAPGRRRLCVPGSASECCAGAKLRSGPWRGGGGKDVGCRANIMHNQYNKGQTMFNLHITAICTGNCEQNCFRCATQRRCFFCTQIFCMRR